MALVYYGQSAYGTPTYFRLFTKESLTKIDRRIQDEKTARDQARELARERMELEGLQADKKPDEEKLRPNPSLEVGRTLPSKLGEFPSVLFGKPIEDLDQYYHNKYVSTRLRLRNSTFLHNTVRLLS